MGKNIELLPITSQALKIFYNPSNEANILVTQTDTNTFYITQRHSDDIELYITQKEIIASSYDIYHLDIEILKLIFGNKIISVESVVQLIDLLNEIIPKHFKNESEALEFILKCIRVGKDFYMTSDQLFRSSQTDILNAKNNPNILFIEEARYSTEEEYYDGITNKSNAFKDSYIGEEEQQYDDEDEESDETIEILLEENDDDSFEDLDDN